MASFEMQENSDPSVSTSAVFREEIKLIPCFPSRFLDKES